jgi:hypothetical protein
MMRLATASVIPAIVAGCLFLLVQPASARTFEWREEVALHDGGIIVVAWRAQFVPGEPFGQMAGAKSFKFNHPTTGQPIVWENAGKIGSRLSPTMLDVDAGRLFLVTRGQSVADYSSLGCPTPPYFVFRYDAGTWVRVPLVDLPTRFWKANLLGFPGEDLIRESKGYLTATQVESRFDALRKRGDTEYFGRIDRRIRNPIGLGCSRGAIEQVYGVEKYSEWIRTGNWLDKTEDEALKLLGGDEGPPCPSRSPCLACRTSPPTTDAVCGWVLWLTTKTGRYAKEAEVSRVSAYRTQPECDAVLAQTLTEQGKLDNRTVSKDYGEVITWLGKRGETLTQLQKWECLPDVMDPRRANAK